MSQSPADHDDDMPAVVTRSGQPWGAGRLKIGGYRRVWGGGVVAVSNHVTKGLCGIGGVRRRAGAVETVGGQEKSGDQWGRVLL